MAKKLHATSTPNNDPTRIEHRPLWKKIVTDILGVAMLICVPFLGPLPGPGGIPLLLGGLSLLAMNHEFAQQWLQYVKKHSQSLRDIVFPEIRWIQWTWDFTAIASLVFGMFLQTRTESWIIKIISLIFMASSTTIFLLNKNRIESLSKKMKLPFERTKGNFYTQYY